jgi:molecular chaperone DnaK (HSP70)
VCVTGLPATWSTDKELAGALVHRLKEAAPLGSVRVIAEPLGMLYATVLDDNGEIVGAPELQQGRVAVVDVGHYTVDVAVMDRLIPAPASLVTYQLGTARPLQAIQQRLSAAFEVELPLYRVDQAVRSGMIRMAGRDEPLPHGWDMPFHENGQEIASRLVEAWGGSGRQFDAVLIGGGGAEIPTLVAALQARFKQARPVPDGQLAIALGYARLARRLGNAH